ncbi:BamA/TamA family outer membrane protein [bacterium]|jgi:outer membrane protein insertion porin family|nr:BamA/TamA family outer membrane protein [bacterium]
MNFKRYLFVVFGVIVLLASVSHAALSTRIVRDVAFEGLSHVTVYEVPYLKEAKRYMGQIVTDKQLSDAVHRFYLSGYFSYVGFKKKHTIRGTLITFVFEENPIIQSMTFQGLTIYSPIFMERLIDNKVGKPLNIAHLDTDVKKMESTFRDRGFDLFTVQETKITPDGVLIFRIVEGIVGSIEFEGMTQTQPFIVGRELSFQKGDVFNSLMLRKDRARILRLGYFSSVSSPRLSLAESGDSIDIKFDVKEKKINMVSVGIEQLEQDEGVAAFSKVFYNHLFLESDTISAKAQVQFGEEFSLRSYSLRYAQPWLLNTIPVQFAVDFYTEFRSESFTNETTVRNNIRQGGDIILSSPLITDEFTVSMKGKVESVRPQDGDDFDSYDIHSLTAVANFDDRINKTNPFSGEYLVYSMERGGNFGAFDLGGLDFNRWSLNMAKFFGIGEETVLATRFFYGDFSPDTAANIQTFDSEEFPLGGSNSLRGYHELSFYGKKRVLFNVEYRHQFSKDIQGVLFYDLGQVFEDDVSTNLSNYESGAGFGVRYFTALAPLRLDFGWGGSGDLIIHFNLGQAF